MCFKKISENASMLYEDIWPCVFIEKRHPSLAAKIKESQVVGNVNWDDDLW